MVTDDRQPGREPAALAAWQEAVAATGGKPWLAGKLARQGSHVFRRFVYFYHRLVLQPGHRQRWQRRLGMSLAGAALLLALSGSPTGAVPTRVITVDGTVCTLADAITAANTDTATGGCPAGGATDTIELQVDVTLSSALPGGIGSGVTLNGNGHSIRSTQGEAFHVLYVGGEETAPATVNQATISGGKWGVIASGFTTLNGCIVNDNVGGGIYGVGFGVVVNNSTITGNGVTTKGSGIEIYYSGKMVVNNSTISGNGGGIVGPGLTVRNSTISGNSSFGLNSDDAHVSNTIVAKQASGSDCKGAGVTSDGYNIASDASCGFTAAGDQQNVTAAQLKLGPLAVNGSATQTMALAPGSVAVDRIPTGTNGCGASVTADQRGLPRPFDGDGDGVAACDVGAFELQPLPPGMVQWFPLVRQR